MCACACACVCVCVCVCVHVHVRVVVSSCSCANVLFMMYEVYTYFKKRRSSMKNMTGEFDGKAWNWAICKFLLKASCEISGTCN